MTPSADSGLVRTFRVDGPVHFLGHDALLEPLEMDIAAGTFTPKNEQEEYVAQHLVTIGAAKETTKKGATD